MVSCQSLLHYCTGGVLVLWLCGGFWPHRQRNSKVATRETESQIALIASRLSVAYSYSSKATVTMAIVFFAITVCDLHTFAYCSLSFFFFVPGKGRELRLASPMSCRVPWGRGILVRPCEERVSTAHGQQRPCSRYRISTANHPELVENSKFARLLILYFLLK